MCDLQFIYLEDLFTEFESIICKQTAKDSPAAVDNVYKFSAPVSFACLIGS